jgi:hypothetical protein
MWGIWFSILSRQGLRGASFTSPRQLRQSIPTLCRSITRPPLPWNGRRRPMKLLIAVPALNEEESTDSIIQRSVAWRDFICANSPVDVAQAIPTFPPLTTRSTSDPITETWHNASQGPTRFSPRAC